MILAFMLARAGVRVTLLEAHRDFDRDFRGDTLQPSALEILDDLGLMDTLLALPHLKKSGTLALNTTGDNTSLDMSSLDTRFPFAITVPQARLLPALLERAREYPTLEVHLGARVNRLVEEGGRVCGVEYTTSETGTAASRRLRALVTVATDGRFSTVRKLAGIEPVSKSSPMDILWFRIPRLPGDPDDVPGPNAPQRMLLVINRQDHWQLGYLYPKGTYKDVRARGLDALREEIAGLRPALARNLEALVDWKGTSVLSVEIDRVTTWHREGLLLIGDAAHAMSPIGSVGISYAIQDAVVAAEVLVPAVANGIVRREDLALVQRRRELPVRLMQGFQAMAQQKLFASTARGKQGEQLKVLRYLPFLPRALAWFIQLGPFRAKVTGAGDERDPRARSD